MSRVLSCYILALTTITVAAAPARRGVNVADCIQMPWLVDDEVKLSPDASKVAYLIKRAELSSDENVYRLFVRDLRRRNRLDNGKLVYQGREISGLQWTNNGKTLSVLSHIPGTSQIHFIDVKSGERKVVVTSHDEITSYVVGPSGRTIVFAGTIPTRSKRTSGAGILVPFGVPYRERLRDVVAPRARLYLASLDRHGNRKITSLPFRPSGGDALTGLDHLTVSPDGRLLTFACFAEKLPNGWENDPLVSWRRFGGPVLVTYLYDLRTRRAREAFGSPALSTPVWSDDSKTFAILGFSPIASPWENDDLATVGEQTLLKWGPLQTLQDEKVQSLFHLFAVDAETSQVSMLVQRLRYESAEFSVHWVGGSNQIDCLVDAGTIIRLQRQKSGWREVKRFVNRELGGGGLANSGLSLGGNIAIGVGQSVRTTPNLYLYDLENDGVVQLTALGREFDGLDLGQVEPVSWTNIYGAGASGYLIRPVGYEVGRRYPLVIMAKTWDNRFVCDGFGSGETTAFPPQPLASAAFVVLLANDPSLEKQPLNFPGRMGEVYNWMETIKSAAKMLVDDGLVEPERIGIIGFSRTSWETDFMLTHSDFKFAAASSADGGLYNYGAYWTHNMHDLQESLESQVGGPPYGHSFQYWLDYAPAFSAARVDSPLLMEYTSEGGAFDEPVDAYELFTALKRQGKAVELYFYPRGEHQLEMPLERLSSLQLNVDWFRFWLQGYERPGAKDPSQYSRWRTLREQHDKQSIINSIN